MSGVVNMHNMHGAQIHTGDTDSPASSPDPSLLPHTHNDNNESSSTSSSSMGGTWARRHNQRVLDLVTHTHTRHNNTNELGSGGDGNGNDNGNNDNDKGNDNDNGVMIMNPLQVSSSLSGGLVSWLAQNKRVKQTCCCFAVLFFLSLGGLVALGIWIWQLKKNESGSSPSPLPPQPSNLDWLAKQVDSVRNSSADPCDDFYQYACGGWIQANTPIPDDVVRLSRSFTVIGDANLAVLKAINDEQWPVIGPFYKSCMDTEVIDTYGHSPIDKELDTISKIGDRASVLYVAGDLLARQGVTSLFGVGVIVDSKNPAKNILDLSQGGLSLGIPDYYSDNDTRDAYSDHMARMFTLLGDASPSLIASSILSFESKIAEFTLPLEELRDPERIYNKYNITSIQQLANLHWIHFFNATRIPYDTLDANVQVPKFMIKLAELIDATPIADLQNYLKWRVLTTASPKLSASFANETFRFFSGVLSGQKVQQARWKTCTSYTDSLLGDILGRYFVQRAFNGQSLNITQKLIKLIEVAFGTRLPDIDWMDDTTRAAARVKLSQVVDLVGYPDRWADYSSVSINGAKFYDNTYNLQQYGWNALIKVLTGPVDKTRWQMTPPTVNAYYDPSYNTINFPAGIIQPTFFSAAYPMAMNFGGIGMVMGHELTHGFDDQGRQYDGTGLLKPWWTQSSIDHFTERASCLVNQYSQFKIGDDHVNGNLTLGENIADNGGIRIAFNAYRQWVKDNGEEATLPTAPSLTNNQLYFLSFAQGWCTITRDAAAKQRLKTDVHSPPFARVLGPLRNFDEFAKAYNCPIGSPMNPKDKCLMW